MHLREVLEMVRIGYLIVVHSESLTITDRKTLNVRPQDAQTCIQVSRIALTVDIQISEKWIYLAQHCPNCLLWHPTKLANALFSSFKF